MQKQILEAEQKALEINLDTGIYGTFCWNRCRSGSCKVFFKPVLLPEQYKTMSGVWQHVFWRNIRCGTGRYVCESRLYKMLEHEFTLCWWIDLVTKDLTLFLFLRYRICDQLFKTIPGMDGLVSVFQKEPHSEPNDLVIHVKMLDKDNRQQQQTVGMLGVNLIYACFFFLMTWISCWRAWLKV